MEKWEKKVEEQAWGHWDFIKKILCASQKITEFLYVEAFIHGYKHAKEDKENDLN